MAIRNLKKCRNFKIYENFKRVADFYFSEMAKNIGNFFVIFIQVNALLILIEIERDRMSPRENTENGRIGAHGLKWKFL